MKLIIMVLLLAISCSIVFAKSRIEESKSFKTKIQELVNVTLAKIKQINENKKLSNQNICVWKICSKPLRTDTKTKIVKSMWQELQRKKLVRERARMRSLLGMLYIGQY